MWTVTGEGGTNRKDPKTIFIFFLLFEYTVRFFTLTPLLIVLTGNNNNKNNNFGSCVIATEQHSATAACSQLPFFLLFHTFQTVLFEQLAFLVTMATFFAYETFT